MKKVFIFLILFVSIFCAKLGLAHGQVVINEIMYDLDGTDTDREWIEIYNTGSAEVDIASWKFFEGNTNHSLVPDSASKIPAGGYGIIVSKVESFKADWPNFSGLIFDSSFSLNNDPGENLAIKDSTGTIVDQVAYTADPSGTYAGKSLQKAGSNWVTAAPTVGAANATVSDTDATGGNAGSGGVSTTEESPVKKPTEVTVAKISAEILVNSNVVVNKEVVFDPLVLGLLREKILYGKFVWNFGDGFAITKSASEKVTHTYKYPGDYVVILNYFSNPYAVNILPDASDRVILTVQIHGLSITNFDQAGAVTLQNTDTKEFDLTNWTLYSGGVNFLFPEGTIILPGKSLTISAEITGFHNENKTAEVVLFFPNMVQAYKFPNKSSAGSTSPSIKLGESERGIHSGEVLSANSVDNVLPDVPLDNQTASVVDAIEKTDKDSSNFWPVFLFVVLIVGASVSMIFIRRKNKSNEISADDIAIMNP